MAGASRATTGRCRGAGRCALAAAFTGIVLAGPAAAQPTSDAGIVRFVYPDSTPRAVFLAGDFNGWSPTATPLDREDAGWVTRVFLDPGVYEYKFAVDGELRVDPGNPERSPAGNSVVRVGPDGEVQPQRPTPAVGATAADSARVGASSGALGWQLRYLGYLTSRRDPGTEEWDLARPVHDVDLRLDARITPDVAAWVLANLTNAEGSGVAEGGDFALRYDRGAIEWTPGTSSLVVFERTDVALFDDPLALVGRVGIYEDRFGYRQLGVRWKQRILGARLEALYTDDEDSTSAARAVQSSADDGTRTYTFGGTHAGGDVLAARLRGGTDGLGFGLGLRLDRGQHPGTVVVHAPGQPDSTRRGTRTVEHAWGWGVDLRGRTAGIRWAAEVQLGRREAEGVEELDCPPGEICRPSGVSSNALFGLDASRRFAAVLRGPEPKAPESPPWSARPGSGRLGAPEVAYEYEEHDFEGLAAGQPLLARRHLLRGGIDFQLAGIRARCDAEQHWFRAPDAAPWDTHPWFRQQNSWLDEDVVRVERLTLLGLANPVALRLHAARPLWPAHGLMGELHATWAAPGLADAPRYFEGILRLALPLAERLDLRTHSRLAVYRRFETSDPILVAALGPGPHFLAGRPPFSGAAPVDYSYQALSAHFVELVYSVTSRSDIALGFGVDPFVVYSATNEYEPIGYDEFLFANGASPADALADPEGLGDRIHDAERALERERRVTLEARLRF